MATGLPCPADLQQSQSPPRQRTKGLDRRALHLRVTTAVTTCASAGALTRKGDKNETGETKKLE